MSTIILVHGAFHGAWSWYKIIPLLEQAGRRVIARDLPGHGHRAGSGEECSLKSYAASVCDLIDREDGQVTLVGHSMGGAVISQAAEMRAMRVAKLVYVAAFLPKDGQSVRSFSKPGAKSALYENVTWSDDRKYATLKADKFGAAFCHDAPAADAVLGGLLSVPEDMAPPGEPVSLTENRFGKIPRAYVVCAQDRALDPQIQKAMVRESPCDTVVTLDAAHSPMLSRPEELAQILLRL